MEKNRTMKKAREARTTAVILTEPKSLDDILKSIHDCRDCQHCIRLVNRWICNDSLDSRDDEVIAFKHHYISPCEKFTQKYK